MQKTAYEMRISVLSSDVCSSDLAYDIGRPAWRMFHQGRNGSGLLRIEKESGERGSHSGRVVRSCPSRPDHSAAAAVPSDSAYRLRGDCPALCKAGRIDYTGSGGAGHGFIARRSDIGKEIGSGSWREGVGQSEVIW